MRAPSGQCRAPGLKSGRRGDYVWFMRGSKQCRRVYVIPKDPRKPAQVYWRALLGAASTRYSHSLSEVEINSCIAAGAKLRSRPRLGQWGWLTGQQYWARRECRGKAEARMWNEEAVVEAPCPQRVTRTSWELRKGAARVVPWQVGSNARPFPGRASVLASRELKIFAQKAGFTSAFTVARDRKCSSLCRTTGIVGLWRRQRWASLQERGPPQREGEGQERFRYRLSVLH